ncbi:DUF1980 domain-containing protein [Paenibacillus radicis (ex Gao et al. 2016)]|uniref:DUF1980 domain-containing protein n=1 Tax=Paenibacillus radicis (ex Gao et al. 2016) TaxID=1737354 RepID=A0A917H0S4_9BACL|nr:DUF1980 domain-containing protein [Paenibacillus radicis (ex Gao et al. 2016)]GGG63861.1 hypothetical protein GCM10010918_17330 [Paenibacillus radicis (ex Gao et al. 2016)]
MNDRWIRAALLSGFAMLIAYFHHTGQLSSFVEPSMELYVKLSSLGLLAAAIHQAYEALRPDPTHSVIDCECGHDHHHGHKHEHHEHEHGHEGHSHASGGIKSLLIYGLFLLPLLLGYLLPSSTSANDHAFHQHTHDHGQDHIREPDDSKKDR